MNNKLIEAMEAERNKTSNQSKINTVSEPPDKQVSKQRKQGPHLAVTHADQGGAASGRNIPLMLKAKDNDLEAFMKCMKDDNFILELFVFVKNAEPEIYKTIINKGKSL